MKKLIHLTLFILPLTVMAQNTPGDLELEDPEDIQLLLEEFPSEAAAASTDTAAPKLLGDGEDLDLDSLEDLDASANDLLAEEAEVDEDLAGEMADLGFAKEEKKSENSEDELNSLEEDLGKVQFDFPEDRSDELKEVEKLEGLESVDAPKVKIVDGSGDGADKKIIFEVGRAEQELLEVAKTMQGKIPNSEWNEIAGKSTSGTYKVMAGDWLWKISKQLFGTGFYYAKIWALNPYITNPHEIEPGMILSFSTGSDNMAPTLAMQTKKNRIVKENKELGRYEEFGEGSKPPWVDERERLKQEGVYFQYSTQETEQDLMEIGKESLVNEYEVYEPPKLDFAISVPESEYDDQGFDKNSKLTFDYKEGFYLTTFVSSNVVQDFGKLENGINENIFFRIFDRVFVTFDDSIDVIAGDKFSLYSAGGEISHKNSDRNGFKYTIVGSLKAVQKHDGKWECEIIEVSEALERGSRVTVYTPSTEQIIKTYNSRVIEAVLLNTYKGKNYAAFGDVVYLDRGRADGVEVGNVFQVYGFKDRATNEDITGNPVYKNGEVTVINLTDNFATAIVTSGQRDFKVGDIAVTKTKEEAARVARYRSEILNKNPGKLGDKAIDELDVELNLDDLNDELLDKADKIQFSEDELAELERQERERSIITENEKDLRSLERLETDLESAEKMLNEARLDEDKLLESQNLNDVEKKFGIEQQESLDELEENFGKRYLDEDINDKENPYGLTEFDIEEIDELLNTEDAVEEQ